MERNRPSILKNIADIARRSRDILVGKNSDIAASPAPTRTISQPSIEFPEVADYGLALKRCKVPRDAAVRLKEAYNQRIESLQSTVELEAANTWKNFSTSKMTDEEVIERYNCILKIHLNAYTVSVDRLYASAVEIVLAQLRVKHGEKPKWNKKWVPLLVWWFTSPNGQYPDEDQKRWLSNQTGLAYCQITIWFQNRRARTKKRIAQGKHVPQTRKTGSLAPVDYSKRPACQQCHETHASPPRLAEEPTDLDEDGPHQRDGALPSVREIIDLTAEEDESNILEEWEEPDYSFPTPFDGREWEFPPYFAPTEWPRQPVELPDYYIVNEDELAIFYKEFSHLNVTPPEQDEDIEELIYVYDNMDVEVPSDESDSDSSSSDSDSDEDWEEVNVFPKRKPTVVTIDNAEVAAPPPPLTEEMSLKVINRGVGKVDIAPRWSRNRYRPTEACLMLPPPVPRSIPRPTPPQKRAQKLAVCKNIIRDKYRKPSTKHMPSFRMLPEPMDKDEDDEDGVEERDVDTPPAVIEDEYYYEDEQEDCASVQDTSPEASMSGSSHMASDPEDDQPSKPKVVWTTSGFCFPEDYPGLENVEKEDIVEMSLRDNVDFNYIQIQDLIEPRSIRRKRKKPAVPLPLPEIFNIPFAPAIAEIALEQTIKEWGLDMQCPFAQEPEYDHLHDLRRFWTPEYQKDCQISQEEAMSFDINVQDYYMASGLDDHFLVLEEPDCEFLHSGWPRPHHSAAEVNSEPFDYSFLPETSFHDFWKVPETDYNSVVPTCENPIMLWNPYAGTLMMENDLRRDYGRMGDYLNPDPELWPLETIPDWKYETPPVINSMDDFFAYLDAPPAEVEIPPITDVSCIPDPRILPSAILESNDPEFVSSILAQQPPGFEFDKQSADLFAMLTGHEFSGEISTKPVPQHQAPKSKEETASPSSHLSSTPQKGEDGNELLAPGFLDWLRDAISVLPLSVQQEIYFPKSEFMASFDRSEPVAQTLSQPVDLLSFNFGPIVTPDASQEIFSSFVNPTLPALW